MEKERDVVSFLSVFHLTISKALDLSETVSTRVMFRYDEKQKLKEFRVLNNGIAEDTRRKIAFWLEENVDIHDVANGLDSNEMDGDSFFEINSPFRLSGDHGTHAV